MHSYNNKFAVGKQTIFARHRWNRLITEIALFVVSNWCSKSCSRIQINHNPDCYCVRKTGSRYIRLFWRKEHGNENTFKPWIRILIYIIHIPNWKSAYARFDQACYKMRFEKTHFLVKQTWIVNHWCQIWSEKTFFAKNAFEVFFFFMTTYISAAFAVLLKEMIYLCFRKQS